MATKSPRQLILRSPLDMHVHFREGNMMKNVVHLTTSTFSGALVMPNTRVPITTLEQVQSYMAAIEALATGPFEAFMTLYFQPSYTEKFLREVQPYIKAIKFYPKGMTTNSDHGCSPTDADVWNVLSIMEKLGIVLCVHGEAEGYHEDRESLFLPYYESWAQQFPDLKIVMEHITDRRTLNLLGYKNVYATVTAHHLLVTGDDVNGGLLNPHLFCKPIPKRDEDRTALRNAVLYQDDFARKIMFGSDSAPHPVESKVSECGCAGVFTAPIALQLLAPLFSPLVNGQEKFQRFVSDNAQEIYDISEQHDIQSIYKTVVLEKREFVIPQDYGGVVPMWAGCPLEWSIADVTH